MSVAVLDKPGRFVLKQSEVPGPSTDELLVKVRYCGICGSDLHTFLGNNLFVNLPAVLGHEMVGEVVATGPDVQHVQVGDRVTYEPTNHCGTCRYCAEGFYNLCSQRTPTIGSYREYVVFRERQVHKVPASISDREATLIEPLASALHAVEVADLNRGQRVLIIGSGTIGILLAASARMRQAAYVVVTNRSSQKLETARRFGADETIHTPESSMPQVLNEQVGEETIDIVFDTVASRDSIDCGLSVLRKGGSLIVVGTPAKTTTVDVARIFTGERRVVGVLKYRNEFPEAISLLSNTDLDLSSLVSAVFPLKDIQAAFAEIAGNSSRYIKCLIAPGN
jgi:L-iditol 2-dehydrogenase